MELFCPWEPAQYLFFSSNVPPLLYYSHLTALLAAIIFSFVLIPRARESLAVKLFLLAMALFSAWTTIDVLLWASNRPDVVLFYWSLQILLETFFYAAAFYFAYVFIAKKDLGFIWKIGLAILTIPVLVVLPTSYLLPGMDVSYCNAIENPLPNFFLMYGIQLLLIFLILLVSFFGIREQPNRKKEIVFFTTGLFIFLFAFSSGNIIGSLTGNWDLAQAGLFGMPVFIAFLTYTVIRFKSFNIKLISAQALVVGIAVLIGARMFYDTTGVSAALSAATLIIFMVSGVFLVRGVKREIAQREQIENLALNLERANVRLQQIDKLKSEFVSIASHQLRSPLTSIRGYASLLREGSYGPLPTKLQEPIRRIETSATMMAELIDDYLNVSRIEAGNMKYTLVDFNLAQEVEHIVDDLRPEALRRGIVLLFKKQLIGLAVVHADLGKTQQIIHNLLNNSLKYTVKGTVTAYIRDDLKKKQVVIEIIDTGIGMNQKTLHNIFQKFGRGDNASSINSQGTGLGLYVAERMAEAMGGSITAHSEGEWKGSRFVLTLPLAH